LNRKVGAKDDFRIQPNAQTVLMNTWHKKTGFTRETTGKNSETDIHESLWAFSQVVAS